MGKHFMNSVESLVDDAIEGLLRGPGGETLARLEASSGIRVVLRSPLPHGKVALVSGGGSGHEPAHAGFVGTGMLTAAVCGDIFASPPVDAVLAAIRTVTGPAGCLLIVKNYTGDRLNFGLAAERARAEGLDVEMVLVGDDIALESASRPRGLAGTLFVHKIAGAAAESGRSLQEVAALARRVADAARTLSLSLTSCTVPGQDSKDRIAKGQAEFGLGIHGEPGARSIAAGPVDALLAPMQEQLLQAVGPDDDLAVMINVLGGVPPIEALVLAKSVLSGPLGRRASSVIGPAPLMTALDMRGVSLSVLPLDDELRRYLLAEAAPKAWPGTGTPSAVQMTPAIKTAEGQTPAPSQDPAVEKLIQTACTAIVAMAADLDALDARVGDGDTGATFAAGARDVHSQLENLPLADAHSLFLSIARLLTQRAGGSSGVLLSILFAAASREVEDGLSPVRALRQGLERMKQLGGAARGDRTMIDALEPALDALVAGGNLADAAEAARTGADATARMSSARAGRSAYVPENHLSGTPDPGAEGVARLFEALARNG